MRMYMVASFTVTRHRRLGNGSGGATGTPCSVSVGPVGCADRAVPRSSAGADFDRLDVLGRDSGSSGVGRSAQVSDRRYTGTSHSGRQFAVVPQRNWQIRLSFTYSRPAPGFAIRGAIRFGPGIAIGATFAPWGWADVGFDRHPWEHRWENARRDQLLAVNRSSRIWPVVAVKVIFTLWPISRSSVERCFFPPYSVLRSALNRVLLLILRTPRRPLVSSKSTNVPCAAFRKSAIFPFAILVMIKGEDSSFGISSGT